MYNSSVVALDPSAASETNARREQILQLRGRLVAAQASAAAEATARAIRGDTEFDL